MIRTVDLVISGDGEAALAAAADALQRGQRLIVVVLRSGAARVRRRLRRRRRKDANVDDRHITVVTNAEIVCVDGVNGVEAVVIRYMRTGRLFAVNASAVDSRGVSPLSRAKPPITVVASSSGRA